MLGKICYWLVVIGALNYGLMAFGFNFLEKLPSSIGQIVSIAVAVAAIITIITGLKKLYKNSFIGKSPATSWAFFIGWGHLAISELKI